MKQKTIRLMALVVMSILILVSCNTESNAVATLNIEDTQQVEAAGGEQDPLDDEAAMMAYTECLREQGVEVIDPVVDTDGNVGKPDFPEDAKVDGAAWEACAHHLEGFAAEQERKDMSAVIDQYVEFATCMRDRGYDLADPTAKSLDQWQEDWKTSINWDDNADADYEACSRETIAQGGEK